MSRRTIFILLVVVFFISLVFTRFFNLSYTTRFTRDESSNLVDMHRIYVDRDITLLGPIDPTLTIIYPSLTYYLLLPAAIIGNFEPYSPAYGVAFFSILTVFVMLLLTKKANSKLLVLIALLSVVWFPLLESGRWAWNPHLVPFFSLTALYLYTKKHPFFLFLCGAFFGLSFHLHYLVAISFGVFFFFVILKALKTRSLIEPLLIGLGFTCLIIPFIYFDLKNPPGLFFGRFWQQNLVQENFYTKLSRIAISLPQNMWSALFYITQSTILSVIAGLLILDLLLQDIKKYRNNFMFFIPFVVQVGFISLLPTFQNRYVLLGIPFFFVWLLQRRDPKSFFLSSAIIITMIVGSLFSLQTVLTTPTREPDSISIKNISDFIQKETTERSLKNTNIVVVASSDPDPLGAIYRHLLLVRHVPLLSDGEYHLTDNLFVVTTSDEGTARADAANVMGPFRRGPKRSELVLDKWRVYLLNKY